MFIVNCLARQCRRPVELVDPKHLALGERVVKEVNETVISSHDIISRVELARFRGDKFEARYKEFGPCYLQYVEHGERLQAVRTFRETVSDGSLNFPGPSKFIATTFFGVGECQEKTELAGLKIAEAGIPFLRIAADGERDGHLFVILGISLPKMQALCNRHNWNLLATLSACKTGVVVDPFFRLACPASKINECADFVNYMDLFQVKKIKDIFSCSRSDLSKQLSQEARDVYDAVRTSKLFPKDLDPKYIPKALDFICQTKTDLMLGAMQRHFSPAGSVWTCNTKERTVSITGKSKQLKELASKMDKTGVTYILTKHTLTLTNTPMTELVHLEVQMAIGTILPSLPLACIRSYIASPFKGLTVK